MREQTIIRQIYGIGQKKVPQKQIAQQLGITPMTVWRIQETALKKMKKMGSPAKSCVYEFNKNRNPPLVFDAMSFQAIDVVAV